MRLWVQHPVLGRQANRPQRKKAAGRTLWPDSQTVTIVYNAVLVCCPKDTEGGSPSSLAEDCGVVLRKGLTLSSRWSWNYPCSPGWLVAQADSGLGLPVSATMPSFKRFF